MRRASEPSLTMEKLRSAATVTSETSSIATAAANISLPLIFEPAGETPGHAVQYVGQGKGLTVLLESDGIEIAIGISLRGSKNASSLKLQLVNRAAGEAATVDGTLGGTGHAPKTHRKKAAVRRRHRERPGAATKDACQAKILLATLDSCRTRRVRRSSVCRVNQNPPCCRALRGAMAKTVKRVSPGKA
jgi:hypothetical protein